MHTTRVGSPGLGFGDAEAIKSLGAVSLDEGKYPETIFHCAGVWKAGTPVENYDETNAVLMTGVTVDTADDEIPYENHRFMNGEPVLFTSAGRPNVEAPYGQGGIAGLIRNDKYFYVKVVDKDTIEIHGSQTLSAQVDFTDSGSGGAWSIVRNYWFYAEEKGGGSNGHELYNTIGSPQVFISAGHTGNYRTPADDAYWDVGCDVDPMALSLGGELEFEVTGLMKQGATGDRVLYYVLDPDPDVRADGYAGEILFNATVVGATDVFTKVAHGLKHRDVVQVKNNHNEILAGLGEFVNLFVRRIDADTFYLCTDPELTAIFDVLADTNINICKPASGGRNRIRFAFTVPNTVSTIQAVTITDATWVLNDLELTSTGDFAGYVPRAAAMEDGSTGDFYETTSTDAGWTDNKRYPVESRTSDDAIVLLDPDGDAPADDAVGVSDGVLYQLDFVPFKITCRFVKDLGELNIVNAVGCGMWLATLEVFQSNLFKDPATAADVFRVSQGVSRTFPRLGTNFTETRRHDFGPHSRIWYYEDLPASAYAVDEVITGATSGAAGIVIEHDLKRQTILYRPTSLDNDFIPFEEIEGESSNTMTIGPIERGPLPTRIAQRIAVSGVQDGAFDVRVLSSRVTLHRIKPA
jgi:hypothetical protein